MAEERMIGMVRLYFLTDDVDAARELARKVHQLFKDQPGEQQHFLWVTSDTLTEYCANLLTVALQDQMRRKAERGGPLVTHDLESLAELQEVLAGGRFVFGEAQQEGDHDRDAPPVGWLCACGAWAEDADHCRDCKREAPWGCQDPLSCGICEPRDDDEGAGPYLEE